MSLSVSLLCPDGCSTFLLLYAIPLQFFPSIPLALSRLAIFTGEIQNYHFLTGTFRTVHAVKCFLSLFLSGLVPRLTTLSSLNFPVPSPAIPMSPTVTNFLTAPVPAASTSTYIPAPSPASYFGALPSPATPYQFPIRSPATPQAGTPSPAMLAPSPGNTSRSPQVPGSTTHHQRMA